MEIFNLRGDEWDRTEEREGWRSKDARVGARLGAELSGGSLYQLERANRLWPYHTHHAHEEWLIVVTGTPTPRGPDGEQDRREGDVACFRAGWRTPGLERDRRAGPRADAVDAARARDRRIPRHGKVGTRDARGNRLMLARPGPAAEYRE